MPLKTSSANRKDISTASNGVTLEHRHFALIAATLKASHPLAPHAAADYPVVPNEHGKGLIEEWQHTVRLFADACQRTNPKFDRARFLAACEA